MLKQSCVALTCCVVLLGCATGPDGQPQVNKTAIGGAIGAVAGGVLGNRIDEDKRARGTAIGAATGAAVGAGVGYLFDRQEAELKRQLAEERAANQIEVERVRDDLLKLTLTNEVLFDFDSAAIKPTFEPTLRKLADVLAKYDRNQVQVVGHTDAVGSETYNQTLSERRALAVAQQLALMGVPRDRIAALGRGELEPRAENTGEAGRQLNRRVEIFVQPVA